MRRAVTAVAFVLTGTLVSAQDPRPVVQPPAAPRPAVQPNPVPVQPGAQPILPRPIMVTPARMAQLEEELETLEATRDVKKAHVKAAEVSVEATKVRFDLVAKTSAATGAGSQSEVLTVKFDYELAKAQLEIRLAEVKEIEVKVKYAKKRLDDAKLGGVRPLPGGARPAPVDPAPNPAR